MVGVTVNWWGPKMADEVLHFFEGWVIFIACAGFLMTEIYLLARLSGKTFSQVFHLPTLAIRSNQEQFSKPGNQWPLLSGLVLVFAAGLFVHVVSQQSELIPERIRFATFPNSIGDWHGHISFLDSGTEQGLGLDDYILSDYEKPNGKPVNLYVAYYSSQRNGSAPHSPAVCIPGGGWLITDLKRTTFYELGSALPLNRVVIERAGIKQIVYYWFDERGRPIANEYLAKWYLFLDAITKNRTDGSLIRLTTQVFPGETERNADDRLQSFMQDIVPTLSGYLPSEQGLGPKSALSHSTRNHG